jgi:cell division transport system ATP-binding protein
MPQLTPDAPGRRASGHPLPSSRTVCSVIRFEKITKNYPGPGTPALDNVTIDIDKGEFVYLVGQSGSGKSTALRLVLRELRPTSGRIYVAGKEINRMAGWKVPRLRRQIGTVFQDFRLLPNKTVSENVAFALQVIGKSRKDINRLVPETLDLVGLADKAARMPDELSGGEQQRVAVARAYVNRPMIIIADEPTGNLDPATSVGIMNLLEDINEAGTTVVMATHDHGIVDQMRKRVIELENGRVVRDEAAGAYGFQH